MHCKIQKIQHFTINTFFFLKSGRPKEVARWKHSVTKVLIELFVHFPKLLKTFYFHSFAPPSLAGSWDNVGLLVEPSPPHRVNSLLLTNDLTAPVMEEALQIKVGFCWSLLTGGCLELTAQFELPNL